MYIQYLFDGLGRSEPEKSLTALTGRLFLVDERPHFLSEPLLLKDATALRHVADKFRLPVLHFIGEDAHEFYLIGQDHTVLMWRVPLSEGQSGVKNPEIAHSL